MSSARLRPLTPTGLATITDPCQHCGFPTRGRSQHPAGSVDRTDWAAEVSDLWGLCGVAAHRDGDVVGYLSFTPAELMPNLPLPGQLRFGDSGIGPDTFSAEAAVITAVEVCSRHRHNGIGRDLVRSALGQLGRRQVSLIEVAGVLGPKPVSYLDSGSPAAVVMLPVTFWQAVGFRVVRPHPVVPLLRLELDATVRRLPDFAAAWRRFAELVSHPGPAHPGPAHPAQPGPAQHTVLRRSHRQDQHLTPLS